MALTAKLSLREAVLESTALGWVGPRHANVELHDEGIELS